MMKLFATYLPRIRFSLASLLLIVTVVCLSLGWVSRALRQRRIVESLNKVNGQLVWFAGDVRLNSPDDFALAVQRYQARKSLLFHMRECVVGAKVYSQAVEGDSACVIEKLGMLYGIEQVQLYQDNIDDKCLFQLAHWNGLQEVVVNSDAVSDVGIAYLGSLPHLKSLDIRHCRQVTAEAFVQQNGFRALRHLDVAETGITTEQIEAIRRALPNCEVVEIRLEVLP